MRALVQSDLAKLIQTFTRVPRPSTNLTRVKKYEILPRFLTRVVRQVLCKGSKSAKFEALCVLFFRCVAQIYGFHESVNF